MTEPTIGKVSLENLECYFLNLDQGKDGATMYNVDSFAAARKSSQKAIEASNGQAVVVGRRTADQYFIIVYKALFRGSSKMFGWLM
jgi:hypothetical protein